MSDADLPFDYEFEVKKVPQEEDVLGPRTHDPFLPLGYDQKVLRAQTGAVWTVSQMDQNIITESSKSAAIREMQEFIRQAQEALVRLEAL